MSLEAFTGWIKDLVSTNPAGGDPKSQGDDHIRGLKATLKQQFSGLTTATAVTVTAEQINAAPARAAACLPKDGSESMTGTLRAPAGDFRANAGFDGSLHVRPGSRGERAILLFSPNNDTGDDGLYALNDAGAWQGRVISVARDVSGTTTEVRLGTGALRLRSEAIIPSPTHNDNQVATTQFVQYIAPKPRFGSNASAINGIGATEVLVAASGMFRTTAQHVSVATGSVSIDATTGGTAVATIKIVRGSDNVVMAQNTCAISAGTAGSSYQLCAQTGIQLGDDSIDYEARLYVSMASGACNVQAGRAQITAQG